MGHCCTLLVCFLLGIVYNTAASTDIDTIAIGDHVESSFTARTFTIRSCPSPLNWNAVANVSTQDNQGFFLSDCSRPALQRTYLKACYTASHLFFHFYCLDNNIYNPYTRCNDPLFQYDVVELFIAPQPANGQPTQHYIELELSPNSVLFVSNITNPYLDCQSLGENYLDCALFNYSATKSVQSGYWTGHIGIPWSVLNSFQPDEYKEVDHTAHTQGIREGPKYKNYVINFFRIDTPSGQPKEYSCWSCDNSSPPCFHKPAYFGVMYLS